MAESWRDAAGRDDVSEMIEKVARASWEIWRKSKEEEGDPRATMFTFDDAWDGPEREFCIAHARACIEAMREPTSDMIEIGSIQHEMERTIPNHPNPELSAAAQCWRAMVDESIK